MLTGLNVYSTVHSADCTGVKISSAGPWAAEEQKPIRTSYIFGTGHFTFPKFLGISAGNSTIG